jgi:hypothetical protein
VELTHTVRQSRDTVIAKFKMEQVPVPSSSGNVHRKLETFESCVSSDPGHSSVGLFFVGLTGLNLKRNDRCALRFRFEEDLHTIEVRTKNENGG